MQTLVIIMASAAFLIIGFLILVFLREAICNYLKINQRIANQQQIITLLEEQNQRLGQQVDPSTDQRMR